eukprot:15462805-Alexandrium_andersonii.AAC.1
MSFQALLDAFHRCFAKRCLKLPGVAPWLAKGVWVVCSWLYGTASSPPGRFGQRWITRVTTDPENVTT